MEKFLCVKLLAFLVINIFMAPLANAMHTNLKMRKSKRQKHTIHKNKYFLKKGNQYKNKIYKYKKKNKIKKENKIFRRLIAVSKKISVPIILLLLINYIKTQNITVQIESNRRILPELSICGIVTMGMISLLYIIEKFDADTECHPVGNYCEIKKINYKGENIASSGHYEVPCFCIPRCTNHYNEPQCLEYVKKNCKQEELEEHDQECDQILDDTRRGLINRDVACNKCCKINNLFANNTLTKIAPHCTTLCQNHNQHWSLDAGSAALGAGIGVGACLATCAGLGICALTSYKYRQYFCCYHNNKSQEINKKNKAKNYSDTEDLFIDSSSLSSPTEYSSSSN